MTEKIMRGKTKMSSQALEQMLSSVPRMGQEDRAYQTLDMYTSGLSQMYTGPMGPPGGPGGMNEPGGIGGPMDMNQRGPYDPIGSQSDFMAGGPNNIQQDYNLGEMTGDQSLNQYNLTERYDLSGHDNSLPHLNQNINDMNRLNNFNEPKDIIGGGLSNKTTNQFGAPITDGYKGLGPAHNINLFNK